MTSGRSYSSKDVIRRLEDEGWDLVGNNGSHHQFKHPNR
ncbi:MAG: HicA toxin of bacterial toxin-antitoxin, partial [Rhodospirillaceae bacterium]|nr:HicA toxin of bacterial toxin-antitoxin [Rhodospirillaceae bacterium]